MTFLQDALGGYLPLETRPSDEPLYPDLFRYNSARSAFLHLLTCLPLFKHIWLPHYICDAMINAVIASCKSFSFYRIGSDFRPSFDFTLKTSDLFLYVNYFGICDIQVSDVINHFPSNQVIVDCAQSLFSTPYDCLATIYSPRKFVGVPDGGFLACDLQIEPPADQDTSSLDRSNHLLKRIAANAEFGYSDFKDAEFALSACSPLQMSLLTNRLINSIDYHYVKTRRASNFEYFHFALSQINLVNIDIHSVKHPLCYPFIPSMPLDKAIFSSRRIYLPTFWVDVTNRGISDGFEYLASTQLLALPCDQRYTPLQLQRIISVIKNEIHSS